MFFLDSVPKGPMRSLFRAQEGYQLIIADYSQQEARIVSALSSDKRSCHIFNRGGDIYMEVAMNITGRSIAECKEYRNVAKTIVLGINYGGSEYTIHKEVNKIKLLSHRKMCAALLAAITGCSLK